MYIKQSMQLVHLALLTEVVRTQLVCYHSITHSSVPSQGNHVSPVLDWLPALPLQVWLTELEQGGPPIPISPL